MSMAVLYARFSPRRDASTCDSCEKQLADLRAGAAARKLEVRAEFADPAVSGDEIERPGLWNAMAALKRGDVLMVTCLDRLARDVYVSEIIVHELRDRKAKLLSLRGEGTWTDTPEQTFIRQILQSFAEYRRKMIGARTQARMLHYQAERRRMSKVPPYGFRPDPENPSRWTEEPVEQLVIARILAERQDGRALRHIARGLEEAGVPCRGQKAWYHQLIKAILKRAGAP